MPKKTNVLSAYRCERGLVRDENQDAVFADDVNGIYIVADGMGGHNAGAMASRACIRLIHRELKKNEELFLKYPANGVSSLEIIRFLEFCLQSASRDIFLSGEADEDLKGMGTTCSLVVIANATAFLAHVGDSRVYLLRKRKLYQVSNDHSVVNELLRRGHIATDKTADLPPEIIPVRNAITRAIGSDENVEIDTQEIDLLSGDRLLLCSDGFSRYYDRQTEVKKLRLLSPDLSISKTADICLEFAKRCGGEDNISVVVVDYNSEDPIIQLDDIEEFDPGATLQAPLKALSSTNNQVLTVLANLGVSMTLSENSDLRIDDALVYIKKGSLKNTSTNKMFAQGTFLGLASLARVDGAKKKPTLVETYKSQKTEAVRIIRCDGRTVRNKMQSDPLFGRNLLQQVLSQFIER